MVEAALILPLLLGIFLSLGNFSVALFHQISLQESLNEVARQATDGQWDPANPANRASIIKNQIVTKAKGFFVDVTTSDISVCRLQDIASSPCPQNAGKRNEIFIISSSVKEKLIFPPITLNIKAEVIARNEEF